MKKNVVIVDYKLGNLFSVEQACRKIGLSPKISSKKEDVFHADALILPGVGAFGEAMDNLSSLDLVQPIKRFVDEGKPLFGICLGLQLLFTESEEFGISKGLDIIPGYVKKINTIENGIKRPVPQIGWNQIHKYQSSWERTPLESISPCEYFYFVHSFYVEPTEITHALGKTIYEGLEYCSVAFNGSNVFATQFHPEKSAKKGIEIYKNWATHNNLI